MDVRSVPKSRFNPQFNAKALAQSLKAAGIGYRHMPELGGLRAARKDGVPSPNGFWANEHFRNFADYTATPEFREGLAGLRALGPPLLCAILCAEADWRQCHRQIITDYLLSAGETVMHIAKDGTLENARLDAGRCHRRRWHHHLSRHARRTFVTARSLGRGNQPDLIWYRDP